VGKPNFNSTLKKVGNPRFGKKE